MLGQLFVEVSFRVLELPFSSKSNQGSHTVFIAKVVSREIETLIISMKFLPSKVMHYLYRSMTQSCLEYSYMWAGACSHYMLQSCSNRCGTFCPRLSAFVEPFSYC